jgi:hypothetical protein
MKGGKERGERIEKLLNFIKIHNEPPSYSGYRFKDWKIFLTQNFPDWVELIKDQNYWTQLEELIKQLELSGKDPDSLCKAIVEEIGVKMVLRWLNSDVKSQKEAAQWWLENFASEPTTQIWNQLNEEAKVYAITYIFEFYKGEPFETYRRFGWDDFSTIILPPIGYVPSPEIIRLRAVIENAGDNKFLKFIDDLIKERKEACEKSFSSLPWVKLPPLKIHYTPSKDERELIARVMDKFRKNGYTVTPLPPIYLSSATPPIFIAYPELEEESEETFNKKERTPSREKPQCIPRGEREKPEKISIEEILGCYLPIPEIILWQKGIMWYAKKHNFDEELLRGVVLIHEVGHWITHLLPTSDTPLWPNELYKQTSIEVHEGWAQLITWWTVEEIGGKIYNVFENLTKLQPLVYKVYEKFKDKKITSVINSLENLRRLPYPVTIKDWEEMLK